MFVKLRNWIREFRLSLRMKMTLSLSAIAVVLLMSSVISFIEYLHMSNYVSGLIAEDIHHIIKRDRLKALDHLEARTDRERQSLFLQSFQEIACHASNINFPELCCFIFPIHVTHGECSFR